MKSNEYRASLLALLVGGLLLYVAYLTREPNSPTSDFLSHIFVDLAFAILTVAILNGLWMIIGGDPLQYRVDRVGIALESQISKIENSVASSRQLLKYAVELSSDGSLTGLERVVAYSNEFQSPAIWTEALKNSRREVDLMGYTLHVWKSSPLFEDLLFDLATKNITVRVMLMHPDNQHFEAILNPNLVKATPIAEVNDFIDILARVRVKLDALNMPHKFEYRLVKNGLITCQICRTDGTLVAIPYLWSVIASHSPLLFVRGEDMPLYRKYKDEFESLWMANLPTLPASKQQF